MKDIPLSKYIETKRLILRRAELGDISTIFDASRHQGFTDGMGWDPPNTSKELIMPYERNLEAWRQGTGYAFSMELKATKDMVGRATIRKTEKENVWNIGFWTHPDQQRKGYMKEAIAHLLTFGFEELNAFEIEAEVALWNVASEKVLDANGFSVVGKREKGFLKKGKWVPIKMMGIKKQDSNQ